MDKISESLGFVECSNCGKTIHTSFSYYCDGKDLVHHREVECRKWLCKSCVFKIRKNKTKREIIKTNHYCEKHFKMKLRQLSVAKLDELLYHGSYQTENGYFISTNGKNYEEIIKTIFQRRKREEEDESIHTRVKIYNHAKHLEEAGKYEKSAEVYESLELWKDAGRVRKKLNQSVIKHIHVNANELFSQIKKEGLAIPYKCPLCSGTLKIDGNIDIEICPYCGGDIDLQTLSDLVKTLID